MKPIAILHAPKQKNFASVALLLMRGVAGIAFMVHGWGKIQHPFTWMGAESNVPGIFQFLAALSEFGGGLCWVLGFLTPIASFGILCTMAVAMHMHLVILKDPFIAAGGGRSAEHAALFFVIGLVLLALGPGKIALDKLIFGERS